MTARHLLLAAAALLALTAGASAGELVVVEAHGLDLVQGQVLDDAKPLQLKEGQQLTLISASGSILKLRGPYDQAPGAAGGGDTVEIGKALEALTTKNTYRTNVAGLVRTANDTVVLPNPWVIDLGHTGDACLRDGDRVVFWNPAAVQGATLTIAPADRSWRAQIPWPSGAAMVRAPGDFQVTDHGVYLAELGGGPPVAVTLNAIPKAVSNERMQAAWMVEKGCLAQAEALLKSAGSAQSQSNAAGARPAPR